MDDPSQYKMFSKVIYDMQNDMQERASKRTRTESSPTVVKIVCRGYARNMHILTFSNEKLYAFAEAKLIEMDAKMAEAKAAMDADLESGSKKNIYRGLVDAVDTLKIAVNKAKAADSVLIPTPEKGVLCHQYERINPYKYRGYWSHAPVFNNNHFSFVVDVYYNSKLGMEQKDAVHFIRPFTMEDPERDGFSSEENLDLIIKQSISCEIEDVDVWHKK